MKKLILSLFIFCSVALQAQIQIPQVVGLPSALNSKVDKVTGKSLVADTSIIKLNGIQSGAQVNILEGVQRNGANLTITDKKVNVIVPTTPSEVGAEPANVNIQGHISATSNPHSVTKAQVGLGNVDNTSDVNKPISTATQTALNGKQASGTYSTDIHSNITALDAVSNTNTGDETITSIKTKLGAATSVSDGYLKYQDYVKFDGKLSSEVDGSTTNELQTISTTGAAGNITLSNSGGTLNLNVNDADASATNEIQDLSLSGNTLTLSSDATTVDISQATAVLANTAKVSNATHTGDVTGSTALTLSTVNSNIGTFNNVTINAKGLATAGSNVSYEHSFTKNTAFNKNFGTTPGTVLEGRTFGTAAGSAVGDFIQNQNSSAQTGSAWLNGTFTSEGGFRTKGRVANSNNGAILFNDGTGENLILAETASSVYSFGSGAFGTLSTPTLSLNTNTRTATFSSTVNSTGFLLNGNNLTSSLSTNYIPKWNGSNFVNATAGTDYQLPITLTTNGTSGAATFSGNVLNVPNYTSSTINQTRITVNGSTSGNLDCGMPIQTGSYKKVFVRVNGLNGNATYTFPTAFTSNNTYDFKGQIGTYSTFAVGLTEIQFLGAVNLSGWIILEGY